MKLTPEPPAHYYIGLGKTITSYAMVEAQAARLVCACNQESTDNSVTGAWTTYLDGPGKLRRALHKLKQERDDPIRAEVQTAVDSLVDLGKTRHTYAHAVLYFDPTQQPNFGVTSPNDGDLPVPSENELAGVAAGGPPAGDAGGSRDAV